MRFSKELGQETRFTNYQESEKAAIAVEMARARRSARRQNPYGITMQNKERTPEPGEG
jgi:hypothetical protein